jgi:electron transport complex protein RnfG
MKISPFKLVFNLTVTCILAAASLGAVYTMTKQPIDQQKKLELIAALKTTLPEYDNDPASTARTLTFAATGGQQKEITFYYAKKGQDLAGVAFVVTGAGYQSVIRVMLGLAVNSEISGIEVLENGETPGLGTLIATSMFKDQFKGKSLRNSKLVAGGLAVGKDGGDIQATTGATISPRAVLSGMNEGLKIFEEHKAEILAGAPQ